MPDDYLATTQTTGRVSVGGSATGEIETANDFDWFAVELVAGESYVIDLEGADSGGGTLDSTVLRGVYDARGQQRIAGTQTNDGGAGDDARLLFTAAETGTHYIAARGHGQATGTYTVRVAALAGDEAPVFAQASYTMELEENADGALFGIALAPVVATGPDNGAITYSIVAGDVDRFVIDAETGVVVYVGTGEDPDSGPASYELTVRASDGALHSDVTVTVNVGDVEDYAILEQTVNESPQFTYASYAFELDENAAGDPDPVSLGVVQATDPEAGTLTYSIESGDPDGLFVIDSASGALSYQGPGEDYESGPTSHELTVRASDGTRFADATVTVNIGDVPEQEITGSPAGQTVSEPAGEDFSRNVSTAGRIVVGDTATGKIGTSGDRDWFAVELVAGREYRIDLRGSHTGDGTLRDPYLRGIHDAEGNLISGTTNDDIASTNRNSRVAFTATETGTYYIAAGAYSARRGTYELEVRDVSPQAVQEETVNGSPAFGQASYAFALDENAAGDPVPVALGLVQATDPEDGTLIYSIESGDPDGLFAIDPASGALSYRGPGEDYESGTTSYELTVRASDGTGHSDVTVVVDITDVPEQEIIEAPVPRTVSEPAGEDLPTNTSTIGRVAVGDTATGNIGRSVDRDGFAVELVAGREYQIDLRGSPTGDGTLSDPYLRGIKGPDGRRIAGVSNDDGGEGYNSRLSFTPTESGTHYIIAGAFSGHGTYELEVRDVSPQSARQAAVNGSPAFASASYEFALDENAAGDPVPVSLGLVQATDPDNDSVAYSIESGDPGGLFAIDPASGALSYLGSGEDYESGTTSYELTVRASDGTAHSDVTVTINVTDDTDEEELVSLQQDASVSEPENSDFPSTASTTGVVAVGGSATGKIGGAGDRDWFAVELVAGHAYCIDLYGLQSGYTEVQSGFYGLPSGGTLSNPYLRGVYDAGGNLISGTSDDDGGHGNNSRLLFEAPESGTYYIAAGGAAGGEGTYTLSVNFFGVLDEAGDDYDSAATLGDITNLESEGVRAGIVHSPRDQADYYSFTLNEARTVTVRLTGLDDWRDANLFLADADNNVLYDSVNPFVYDSVNPFLADEDNNPGDRDRIEDEDDNVLDDSVNPGSADDRIEAALQPGTYYFRVHIMHTPNPLYGLNPQWTNYLLYYEAEDTGPIAPREDDFSHDTDTTGSVDVGGSTVGNLQFKGDRDWFAVELQGQQAYQIDIQSGTGHGTLAAPVLEGIFDADGNPIPFTSGQVVSGPVPGRYDGRAIFTPSETATYYIQVNAYKNDGGHYVSGGTGTYRVSVSEYAAPEQDDYSGYTDTTGLIDAPGSVRGTVNAVGDRDWFEVQLSEDRNYIFNIYGRGQAEGTLLYPVVHGIYDAQGGAVAEPTDDLYESIMGFSPTVSGTYYISAGSRMAYRDETDITGTYLLNVLSAPRVDAHGADPLGAGTVTVGTSVNGNINHQGDKDWFAIELAAGKAYRIEIEGTSAAEGTLRAVLGLHDHEGNLVAGASNYQDARGGSDLSFEISQTGTYYIAAGAYTRDIGSYTLSVTEIFDDYAEDTGTIGAVVVGGSSTGEIETPNDRDWFAVELEAHRTYRIDLEGKSTDAGTLSNPYLRGIHDANGDRIRDTTDDNGGAYYNSRVNFTATEDATYYVAAGANDGRDGTYTLSVEEVM